MFHISSFASRRARRNSGKYKHTTDTTDFPHVFAHAHNSELIYKKMAKFNYFKLDIIRLSVYLLMILEFQDNWLLFLGHHCIRFHLRNIPRLCSCWNPEVTDTQTDCYNPPPSHVLLNGSYITCCSHDFFLGFTFALLWIGLPLW